MGIYYGLLAVLILILVLSLFLQLLFSPIVWVIILLVWGYGTYKKKQFVKKVEDYQKQYNQQRQQYSQQTTSTSSSANDDVIDVDYRVVEEDNN